MVFVSIEIIVQPFFLDGIFTDHRKGGKMETASPKKNTRRIVEQLTRMSGACNRQISKQHRRDRHNATRSMYITLSFEKVSLPLADTPTPTPPAPRHTPTHEYTHEETSSRWPPYEKKQQNYNEPTKQSDFNSTFFSLFLYVAKRLLFKDKKRSDLGFYFSHQKTHKPANPIDSQDNARSSKYDRFALLAGANERF